MESTKTKVPDRPIPKEESIDWMDKEMKSYQHYNEQSEHQDENQMHHNDEHHWVIEEKALDYSEHHDQANQNLPNVLSDEIHQSKTIQSLREIANLNLFWPIDWLNEIFFVYNIDRVVRRDRLISSQYLGKSIRFDLDYLDSINNIYSKGKFKPIERFFFLRKSYRSFFDQLGQHDDYSTIFFPNHLPKMTDSTR